MGKKRGAYWVLVGKFVGKRLLLRPRRRWEDNIKMDLQEVGWGTVPVLSQSSSELLNVHSDALRRPAARMTY
jgi:hypothetical protein